MSDDDALLAEQIAYYRARAPEYDDWWTASGRYDLGSKLNERFLAEVGRAYDALDRFAPSGDVLELAGGTGNWTRRLALHADRVTVVDASPETLTINRAKVADSPCPVHHVAADLFRWRPRRRYDVVALAFWLSHVPPERFDEFWELVASALGPGGRVFFVDNAHPEDIPAELASRLAPHARRVDPAAADRGPIVTRRSLGDGRTYDVVKVYWRPAELTARLSELGWDATASTTEWAFLHGEASSPQE